MLIFLVPSPVHHLGHRWVVIVALQIVLSGQPEQIGFRSLIPGRCSARVLEQKPAFPRWIRDFVCNEVVELVVL